MAGLPAEQFTNRLLTFLLWWFDLTLIAILLFILLRNFLKLALERHYGILGLAVPDEAAALVPRC